MLKSRAFVRKTKRGNVIKVVKEHYLRDDIYCGIPGCPRCASQTTTITQTPPRTTKLVPTPHYVLPDTNVLYHQIDVMEHAAFVNVIILQTVLEELRHRSKPVYDRVRALIAEPARSFYVFSNEHSRETYIERQKDESPNDRNDRAIRTATRWYNEHLGGARKVVLITDDGDNRRKALGEGLPAFHVRQYVESLADYPELIDMVANVAEEDIDAESRYTYPEHLSKSQILAGLKSGAFHQGTLNISQHNYLEGSIFAKVNGEEMTVMILGREHLNRGVQGDIVAVQMLPKSEWKAAVSVVIDEEDVEKEDEEAKPTTAPDEVAAAESAMEVDSAPVEELKPTGRIVGIIKRNWRAYCGTIDKTSVREGQAGGMQPVFFWAMDRRIPKIRIRTRQAATLCGQRVVVAIDGWPKNARYPQGHYVRTLGAVGDAATETEVLLLEHDVPFAPFSPLVLSFLPVEGEKWEVDDEKHLHGREDFRGLDICSIDPPGCTDIDDALHARKLPNGNYEVGVHIADVSNFVKPENAMDLEAQRRGTTVYLVDKRIDMLPSLLGTNLCSLRSNVDRLAFSCIWEVTPDAKVKDVRYTKSVIRSKASLTYDAAQARLDDPNLDDPVTLGIKALNMLAKKLRAQRIERGALTLASPEIRFKMENDQQDPVDVEMKELKETNALVEEFMLLANIYVAKKIQSVFPESSMLRRHPRPPPSNFETLTKAVGELGLTLDPSTSKTLADSLDRCVLPEEPYINKLIRIMTTRCMMQAVYFCSGTVPEQEFWHYGLASEIYTHFTSPIRRYADLVVHRLLAAAIGYDKGYSSELTDKVKATEMCNVLNYRHRMAQQASRSSVELFTNRYFKGKVVEEEAYVIRVMKNGFSVLIPRYGIEGYVYASPTSSPSASPFTYDADTNRLVAPSATIQLFMKVTVAVTVEEAGQAAAQRSKLVVRLVKPFVEGLSGTPEEAAKKDGKAGVGSARLRAGADEREGKRAKRK
ncbi:exosome catalytic subunit dis3 [Rhizophlyctis rosea]|uniref:Ribosomal RNA-processing protein 44 n=1 Tax=Rhizophlyctis rosea TaxID=64517 RepID=A0AAD5X553_9FUNG|nr:exosome catalytic subunit dis3 [Rhizophlyctis rosea]